jgi:hypothetical protein
VCRSRVDLPLKTDCPDKSWDGLALDGMEHAERCAANRRALTGVSPFAPHPASDYSGKDSEPVC